MNTAEFLTISAAIVPDRVGLVGEDSRTTYGELQSNVNQLANSLKALGVGKGENVGVMAVNSPEFVQIYYASASVGATLVPLNFRAKTEEITHMVNEADVTTLFISERYWSIYESVKDDLPGLRNVIGLDFSPPEAQSLADVRAGGEDIPVFSDVDDSDATLLIYTSGTTSLPKGVVLSYQALTALVVNTQAPADPTVDQEVVLVSVPFYHIAGATTMMSTVFSGRRLVILSQFSPQAWLEMVQNEGVTHAFLVPTMLKRIMEVENFDSYNLSTLRLITYGAAPMPYEVVRTAVSVFPPIGVDLMNAYGQTEATGSLTFLSPEDHRMDGTPEENELKVQRLRSVGRPMSDIDVAMLAPDGTKMPDGQEGEICIRGDRVMKGYNKREADTGSALIGGWLHTGDLGKLDEGGYLFITGRIKDMVIRGGENISTAEIENVLEEHPGIAEASVIGVKDTEWGEVVKAIVVAGPVDDVPSEEELTAYVKSRLASYKAPGLYQWIDELPRNHLGKVLKTDLRDLYGQPTEGTLV
jgi:acyl-CoA synthetase (AMP-forming)/AMP-acid ligase II